VRDPRKPIRPCLEWPGHQALLEARHLRARILWQWTASAMARLLGRTTSHVGKSIRGVP
jgi:hypothetical protein